MKQGLQLAPAPSPELRPEKERAPRVETARRGETLETQLARAVRVLRDDERALLSFIGEQPAWQRLVLRVVLIRELSAPRAARLWRSAFGSGDAG